MYKILLSAIFLILVESCLFAGDTIRIMPVGNSITAGEHYGFPALEERTGYRKDLYEMLTNNGFKVDFVGSQNHGIRSKDSVNWFDWNCEAYPGWKIPDIAGRVKIALKTYQPDILLVHVGTNGKDWEDKPKQVENMLDMFNDYCIENNRSMTIFMCLIISRYIDEDAVPTSKFNIEVTKHIHARSGDRIKIILVDMENGANLDYCDKLPISNSDSTYEGGDMVGSRYPGVAYDKYHPNDKGNFKMALKFYEEITKELEETDRVQCIE